MMKTCKEGFTIVELLIVIVVIAIIAAVTVVAFTGLQNRAATAERNSDFSLLRKSISLARQAQQKTLGQITNYYWTAGPCITTGSGNNSAQVEPRELSKSHSCWTAYYRAIDAISAASGSDLATIKDGDARGNPYLIDENEGDGGTNCTTDSFAYFTGSGVSRAALGTVPLSGFSGCAT